MSTFQLSSYLFGEALNDGLPQIRWHQTADFGYVPNQRMPNTFMAVSVDLCDRNSPFGRWVLLGFCVNSNMCSLWPSLDVHL